MARVFTISFPFMHERHTAMVTMCEEQSGETTCHVKLFNQDLHYIISEGKFSFNSSDKALPSQIQNHVAEELYLNFRQALTNYLSQQPTTALR